MQSSQQSEQQVKRPISHPVFFLFFMVSHLQGKSSQTLAMALFRTVGLHLLRSGCQLGQWLQQLGGEPHPELLRPNLQDAAAGAQLSQHRVHCVLARARHLAVASVRRPRLSPRLQPRESRERHLSPFIKWPYR